MLKRFGDAPVVESRKSLYDGGMQSVMDELQAVRSDVHTTMIVGHEPTMSMAAQWLSSPDSDPDVLGAMVWGLRMRRLWCLCLIVHSQLADCAAPQPSQS